MRYAHPTQLTYAPSESILQFPQRFLPNANASQPLLLPPLFGALPPPLVFVLTPSDAPPSWLSLGLLTSGFAGLAFNGSPSALWLLPSASAVFSADSGLVLLGLKAASEAAAASSEPDLEYSVERGFRESLSCASLLARRGAVVLRKRGCEREREARGARWRKRRVNMAAIRVDVWLFCTFCNSIERQSKLWDVFLILGKQERLDEVCAKEVGAMARCEHYLTSLQLRLTSPGALSVT